MHWGWIHDNLLRSEIISTYIHNFHDYLWNVHHRLTQNFLPVDLHTQGTETKANAHRNRQGKLYKLLNIPKLETETILGMIPPVSSARSRHLHRWHHKAASTGRATLNRELKCRCTHESIWGWHQQAHKINPQKKNVKHFLVLNDPFRVVNAHSCSETFQKNHLGGWQGDSDFARNCGEDLSAWQILLLSYKGHNKPWFPDVSCRCSLAILNQVQWWTYVKYFESLWESGPNGEKKTGFAVYFACPNILILHVSR